MTIAYLILCHIDPEHIKRLTDKITKGTKNVAFVHVDKTCDIKPFQRVLKNNPQVKMIKERLRIHWGGTHR